MKAENFAYWINGYFELNEGKKGLSAKQVQIIKNHLNMVFVHDIDPKLGDKEHLEKLNDLHGKIVDSNESTAEEIIDDKTDGLRPFDPWNTRIMC